MVRTGYIHLFFENWLWFPQRYRPCGQGRVPGLLDIDNEECKREAIPLTSTQLSMRLPSRVKMVLDAAKIFAYYI